MTKKLKYRFTGACPYTNSSQSIEINYFEIPMLGASTPGYKKDSYYCPLVDECPYPDQDRYHRCPVYLEAPDVPC